MNIKKISLIVLLIIIIVGSITLLFNTSNNDSKKETKKIQVVVSNFASYDFLRAIIGDTDDVSLSFLLGPGKDAHSYDPTAQDLIKVQNADLFVYIGGEMESWSDKVLESMDTSKQKIVCIAKDVETIEEQQIDGAEKEIEEDEEEGGFDEHIWTSPKNSVQMIKKLEEELEQINPSKAEIYKKNSENYIAQIENIDKEIKEIVDNKVRDRLVFGDKMPMQYFISYYNLKVSAAFSGCSTETEPSSKTIAYLAQKIKEENIPVVLYVELNDGRVAQTIAKDANNGAVAMQIQSLHNVSKDDFENGATWVSLMKNNIDVLRKALQ